MITINSNFIAIDVEYADREQNICQVGLAIVRDLQIVSTRSWLIQPPGNYYDPVMMRSHHVTPDMTATVGTFDVAWQEIQPVILYDQLWAHNAHSTEQPVIAKNLDYCHYEHDWLDILDSRDLFQRPDCPANSGNTLPLCCMAMGIDFDTTQHHDAEYDAIKCAEIVIAVAKGQQPDWTNVPVNAEEMRKAQQGKRVLRLGEFCDYYNSTSSGEEDVLCEMTSTCADAAPQIIDVFDKGDIVTSSGKVSIDFSRLVTGIASPLFNKKVVLTGLFNIDRKEIELALEMIGAKKVPKPARNTDAVILGTRNVGFTKLIAIEEQEAKGHHLARIVGDADLEELLYGNGRKFF